MINAYNVRKLLGGLKNSKTSPQPVLTTTITGSTEKE